MVNNATNLQVYEVCNVALQEYTRIGVYWGCEKDYKPTTDNTSPLELDVKRNLTIEFPKTSSILSEPESNATEPKEVSGHVGEGRELTGQDAKYLHALIGVSIALVVVVLLLVAVVIYSLILRGMDWLLVALNQIKYTMGSQITSDYCQ